MAIFKIFASLFSPRTGRGVEARTDAGRPHVTASWSKGPDGRLTGRWSAGN
jgi:hypothetical protein